MKSKQDYIIKNKKTTFFNIIFIFFKVIMLELFNLINERVPNEQLKNTYKVIIVD